MNRATFSVIVCSVGLAALSANAYQASIDPAADDPLDVFVMQAAPTATADTAMDITVQNAITGDVIEVSFPAQQFVVSRPFTDIRSGSVHSRFARG